MVENVINSENINTVRGEDTSLPPSSKVKETVEVKEQAPVKNDSFKKKNIDLKEQDKIDPKELNEAIASLNEKLYMSNREIVFKTEEKINKHYISVVDRESQEVIKEWPPKEVRKFLIGLKELEEQLGSNKDIKSIILNTEV